MLSHLRVLDLTDGGAAIGGQMLADLGADVLLIEPPAGVASRKKGPFVDDVAGTERSLEFFSVHRGKRSVTVDLESAQGRDQLRTLAASADIWLDNWQPNEGLERELDYESLRADAPRLVHVSITPFGEIGPKSHWAATDLTVTASSMVMWLTGDEDRPPLSCSTPQAFLHAGSEAASAALIALEERQRSGLGQHIDVSAQASIMSATQSMVLSHGWNDQQLTRVAGGVRLMGYRIRFVYPCADGFANLTFLFGNPLGLGTARFFQWMYEEGQCSQSLRDENWVAYGAKILTGAVTIEEHNRTLSTIEAFLLTKTKDELFAAAFERNLFLVPLFDGHDLLRSKQLAEREFWQPLRHCELDREILYPGPFAKLSSSPIRYNAPPPRLGEHRDEVLGCERKATSLPPTKEVGGQAALGGLRVLDFTWVYAGPAVTRVLADYGATVVRLESSQAADALRAGQPFKDGVPGGERSGNYANINVGKLNLGLNLKLPEAREVALKLVDWADVIVENYSPKAMKNFALDYETLRKRKPELIMLSSCLSGQSGPERMLAGYGTMGGALAGFGFITGWPDRPPAAPFMAYTDYVAPRFALAALLAAVDHRRRTGEGQHIDCSQAESSMHFLGPAALEPSVNGRISKPRGNASPHYAPSGVYPAEGEESWIAIAAPDEESWQALARTVQAMTPEAKWARDPRFANAKQRLQHAEELDRTIGDWTREFSVAHLERELQACSVPCHRVSKSQDCFEDEQLAARDHFVDLEHAEVGSTPNENSRMRFSRTPARVDRAAATLGQDNTEVLQGLLGLSDEEVTALVIAGAIE